MAPATPVRTIPIGPSAARYSIASPFQITTALNLADGALDQIDGLVSQNDTDHGNADGGHAGGHRG